MPQVQPTVLGWSIVTLVGMWRVGAQTTPGVGRAAFREKNLEGGCVAGADRYGCTADGRVGAWGEHSSLS